MSAIQAELQNEYLSWEFTESVTVWSKGQDSAAATNQTGITAGRMNMNQARRMFGEVKASPQSRTFVIPLVLLTTGPKTIRPSDWLIDSSGAGWTVDTVNLAKMDTQAICLCTKRV